MFRGVLALCLTVVLSNCGSKIDNDGPEYGGVGTQRPNILIILTDDQGYADVGAFGAEDLATPNIDKLAEDGVKLTQFYAGAPLCSPSRASLLTGQTSVRAGVASNVSSNPNVDGMPASEVTLAEALKTAGYSTALVGKWHLGSSPGSVPGNQGFDFSFGHLNGCIDNYSHTYFWEEPYKHDLYLNGSPIRRDGDYFPDLMVLETTRFIDEAGDKPFFVFFAMNMPHYPYQGDAQWLDHYTSKNLASPRLEYAAFVSTLDERIGDVIDHLKAIGKYENTIIIFQSDHGYSTESRAMGGGGSAGIYRGAKFSLFEGGIRIPAIIKYSPMLPSGQSRDGLAVTADWFPTLLDMIEIPSSDYSFDGKSILPMLKNPDTNSPHKNYVWQWMGAEAIRDGDWKLLIDPIDTSLSSHPPRMMGSYLYNLKEDPSEKNDLAASHPDRVIAMTELRDNVLEAQSQSEACAKTSTRLKFSLKDGEALKTILGEGWHDLELSHVWSSDEADLIVPVPPNCEDEGCSIKIKAFAVRGALDSPDLQLKVSLNGESVSAEYLAENELVIPFEGKCIAEISLTIPGAVRPSDLGASPDARLLGIALSEIQIIENRN